MYVRCLISSRGSCCMLDSFDEQWRRHKKSRRSVLVLTFLQLCVMPRGDARFRVCMQNYQHGADSCGIHASGAGFDRVDKVEQWAPPAY